MRRKLILFAFFFSGAGGLVYEVVAMRLLRLVMGNTAFAASTVLCAFMGGLALGSWLGGRFGDRVRRPAMVYAGAQFGAALLFLAFPLLLLVVRPVYGAAYGALHGHFYLFGLVRFILCGLLLVPPCVLMGLTLPVLSRVFAAATHDAGAAVGRLYAVNTVGAAVGTLAAGFVLIPRLGVRFTLYLAAGLSLAAAVLALASALGRQRTAPDAVAEAAELPEPRPAAGGAIRAGLLLPAYALMGFTALTYEVAWTRVFSLFIGSSVYAFSLIVGAFLVGLAAGSAVAARLLRDRLHWMAFLPLACAGIGLTTLALVPFMDDLPLFVVRVIARFGGSFAMLQVVEFILLLSLLLFPTVLMGIAFPLAAQAVCEQRGSVASGVGAAFAWNTLGNVLGAFAAGFVLMPLLGGQWTLLGAVCVNVALGAALWAAWRPAAAWQRFFVPAGVVALTVLACAAVPRWDVQRMTLGPFVEARRLSRGGAASAVSVLDQRREARVLYHRDGVGATVTVKETAGGERVLFVNGKADASSASDLPTELLLGHLPVLMHPDPRRVMVVGLASGITLGSVATYPVDSIICVEVAPDMVPACRLFDEHNGRVLDDPRVDVVVADARNHLLLTETPYDVIISQPSNPWMAGIADLFTREFFETCRRRLTESGIMCTWIEAYTLDEEHFRSVVATFQSVFPSTTIWQPSGADYFLVGAVGGLNREYSELSALLGRAEVAADLARVGTGSLPLLLENYVTGAEGARALAGDAPLQTDDRPTLEFTAPRTMHRLGEQWNIKARVEEQREVDVPFITTADDSIRGALDADLLSAAQFIEGRGHAVLAGILFAREQREAAVSALSMAAGVNPASRLVDRMLKSIVSEAAVRAQVGDLRGASRFYREALTVKPGGAEARFGMGYVMERRGDLRKAIEEYSLAAAAEPTNAKYHLALAGAAHRAGMTPTSIRHYRRALALDPDVSAALNNLAYLLATARNAEPATRDEAVYLAKRANRIAEGKDPRVLETLGTAYAASGRVSDALASYEQALQLVETAGGPSAQANRLRVRVRALHQVVQAR